jgi:thiol-disulfide isomerase/thioredoxin
MMLVLVAAVACKDKAKKEVAAPARPAFTFVSVPAMYTDPRQQAEYIVARFWNNLDFSDTTFIRGPGFIDAFAAYAGVLGAVPKEKAVASVRKTWKEAGKDTLVLHRFANLFEQFLYDPNAPTMNEDLYMTVLELTIASDAFEEEDRMRAAHRLEMARKNRMGSRAADFSFTLASGKRSRLYDVKSEYVLIFFNNPGCQACKIFRDNMCASPVLDELTRQGRIKVVAIYPDEDLAEWKAYLPSIPGEWINGYDEELALRGKKLYNLRAIPTLYLLDKEKTVLLKDARFELIEQYLAAMTAPATS